MSKDGKNKKSAVERLVAVMGKDLLSNRPGESAAVEALKQVKEERETAKVAKAKELYLKAIELYEQHEKQKRELENKIKANEKALNKIITSIEKLGNDGGSSEEDEANDEAGEAGAGGGE